MSRVFGLTADQVSRLRNLLEEYEAGTLYPQERGAGIPQVIGGGKVSIMKGQVFESTGVPATTATFRVDNIEDMTGGTTFAAATQRTIANMNLPMNFGEQVLFLTDFSTQATTGVGRLLQSTREADFIVTASTLTSVLDSSVTAGLTVSMDSGILHSVHHVPLSSTSKTIGNEYRYKVWPNMLFMAARVRAAEQPTDDAWSIIAANAKDIARVQINSTFGEYETALSGQVIDHLGSGVDFPSSYTVSGAITINNSQNIANRYGASSKYVAVHTDGMNFELVGTRDNNYVSVNASTGDFLDQRIVDGDVSLSLVPYWPVSGDNTVGGGKEQLGAASSDLTNWDTSDWQMLQWNKGTGLLEWAQQLNLPLGKRPLQQLEDLGVLILNGGLGGGGHF